MAKKLEATVPEVHRNFSRLTKSGFISKNVDNTFSYPFWSYSISAVFMDCFSFNQQMKGGVYELTRIDKVNDLCEDEYGNVYKNMGNDRFDMVYSVPKEFEKDELTSHGCDRNCNWFDE